MDNTTFFLSCIVTETVKEKHIKSIHMYLKPCVIVKKCVYREVHKEYKTFNRGEYVHIFRFCF